MELGVQLEDADLSLEQLGEIQQGLQACFPGREVDLAIINRADPLFLKKITERCRLLNGLCSAFASTPSNGIKATGDSWILSGAMWTRHWTG